MDLECNFPPPASTVIGAIRASLARGRGWSGAGRWENSLDTCLGDGPENLGSLSFTGPFLSRGEELLHPVPAHLLGAVQDDIWRPRSLSAPSEPMLCDLGSVRLAATDLALAEGGQAIKGGDGYYITSTGLFRVLEGECPDPSTIIAAEDLFRFDRRIGLEIDDESGTALEGQLYSPQFVRLMEGVEIWVGVDGVPNDWAVAPILSIGGESRLAGCSASVAQIVQPDENLRSKICKSHQAALILLTPARDIVSERYMPQPGDQIAPGLTLVSACCDRPLRIGGWNSVNRHPEPQVPHLPAGSVLFVTFDNDRDVEALFAHPYIGGRKAHGLGRVAIGLWPMRSSDSSSRSSGDSI